MAFKKKKEKKEKDPNALKTRRVLSNNLFVLGLIHSVAPSYLPTYFLWSVGNAIINFLMNIWLLREIVNRYEEGRPASEVIGMLVGLIVGQMIWYCLIQTLPEQGTMWIEDETERKARYKEILAGGDRVQLIQMIKALYFHQEEQRAVGKKLHISDENFFKEAQRLLHDEFSAALGIPRDDILDYIDQIIAEASDQKD